MSTYIGVDPGKSGCIFFYETEALERKTCANWFAHTYDWHPWHVLRIPLIEPPDVLSLKRDAKGKRIKKKQKTSVDYDELSKEFKSVVRQRGDGQYRIKEAFVERVSGSVSSGPQAGGFNFGTTYGYLRGMIAGEDIPITLVTPQKWKAAVGINSKDTTDKHVSRRVATRFFPGAAGEWARAKDDGVAEAALILQYGLQLRGQDL